MVKIDKLYYNFNCVKNIVKVEFLPFHTLGFSKYSEYNIENPFKNIEAMSNDKCNELYKYFSKL